MNDIDILGTAKELNPSPASTGVLASHIEVPPAQYDFFGNVIVRHGNNYQPTNVMDKPTEVNIIWTAE